MATVQKVYKQSKKGSGSGGATGTITGSSTLEANYVVSETDETFIITQTSHSYSTPTYSGSTGSAAEDVLFKTTFLTKAMLLSDLSINGTTCSDNTPITFNKTHSTQTLNLSLGDSIVATLTIPAKTKYTITLKDFDDTQIGTLTKWYNEDLTLPIATVTGYDFLGWADSSAKATTGQVDYAVGVQYTANAGATLYASCELAYTKPVISGLSIERCKADGTSDDEGRYAKVKFKWSVYRSAEALYLGGNTFPYANNGSTASVTVGTYTATDTSSDASGTYEIIVGNGNLDEDEQYEVTVVLSDTQTIKPDNTDTEVGLLTSSYFPIDFNADGTAMGIFGPAPDDEEGVFLGKGLSVKGNVTASGNLQGRDALLELDTTEQSGDDHDIYTALQTLGWDSEVIV